MTTTDTKINQLGINRLTKTQFNGASPSSTEIYAVDPEFVGGKLLKTNSDGDIVETNETIPTDTNDLTNGAGFITGITSGDVTTALGFTPYDASNPNGYTSNVGTVTSVNNTSPDGNGNVSITIPTVNDATLTIQKNGTDVATFTANSSTNQTANITVPTDTGDLTNGAGFITGITSSDVTTALGYTPYNSSNPSGYQENVIETVKVNGTALTPSSKAVDITVPTNNNQLTNGAGYITGITSSDVTTALGYSPVNPTSLASVATSGSYNDLSNKPTIPAAQVNSDWNANSGVAQILNKPTLATVATSGAYSDLSGTPTIPTVNNPTITITQGGVTKGSFTLNQSTGDTIALDAGGGGSVKTFDLFDYKWSDHIINEVSWLRADTFSWQSGLVYTAAYQHLVADYNGGTSQTETVGSYTITYILADDGHKITTDETNVANIYAESGVAWYYILDTANTRFKLPRENPAREELTSLIQSPVKGNGMTLGWTADGVGSYGTFTSDSRTYTRTGTVAGTMLPAANGAGGSQITSTNGYVGITTDGSKSGLIADLSKSTKTSFYKGHKYLYFYVGNFSQSATEQTAGLNASLFNGKVDLDGSNATFKHIVETYQNGSDWYRVWSDGWCEQGGNAVLGTFSYTFLKPYASIPQVFFQSISANNTGASNAGAWMICAAPTTTGFEIMNGFTSTYQIGGYWEAKGYIS